MRGIDGSARRPYAFFVKVIQSWPRSPMYAQAPERLRVAAAHLVAWRTEAEVYDSDLAAKLPAGLTLPRAFTVVDLDEASTAIWLEWIPARSLLWDLARHERAAYLLGRLAASPSVPRSRPRRQEVEHHEPTRTPGSLTSLPAIPFEHLLPVGAPTARRCSTRVAPPTTEATCHTSRPAAPSVEADRPPHRHGRVRGPRKARQLRGKAQR